MRRILVVDDSVTTRRMVMAALRDGATLYLTKPFTPATFAPEIRRLLAVA